MTSSPNGMGAGREDEEDDYMSMAIAEPSKPKEKETYTQKRIRKQREAEVKGHPKSKKELEADAAAAREAALATALPEDSKGFKMMAKLGFKQGGALGATSNSNARTVPLELAVKEGRSGVGMDNEKKRKIREELEGIAKKVKADEGDYRERMAKEREDRRLEGLVAGAQRVLEGFEGHESPVHEHASTEETGKEAFETTATKAAKARKRTRPIREINVLWRGLVRGRVEKERERRARYDMLQSLSRNAKQADPEEDEQDRLAWGTEETEVEEEDPELDDFNALEPKERLGKLAANLRGQYHYCFWCKFRYTNAEMDGCPGLTEDDHD